MSSVNEMQTRVWRWRFFRIIFALLCVGVLGDVLTTVLGFQLIGSKYEQNPIGNLVIGIFGWTGILIVLAGLFALVYGSCRVIYFEMPLRWSRLMDVVLTLLTAFRWITVVAAVAYLLQRPDDLRQLVVGDFSSMAATISPWVLTLPSTDQILAFVGAAAVLVLSAALTLVALNILTALSLFLLPRQSCPTGSTPPSRP